MKHVEVADACASKPKLLHVIPVVDNCSVCCIIALVISQDAFDIVKLGGNDLDYVLWAGILAHVMYLKGLSKFGYKKQ